jgi:phage terminase large subunit GpA-like protein
MAPTIRTLEQFAEDEIVLPEGPRKGMRLSLDTNPWARVFLREAQSGKYNTIDSTGGRQGGKTLICLQTPLLYHLFEIGESVGYMVPDLKTANKKWTIDLKPIINATRYRELLPKRGQGSKGGEIEMIEFLNGARLIFVTGGGNDANRQGMTFRVLFVTETDKMDHAGGTSEETDKISQAKHCTDSFSDRWLVYQECTLTTKLGRTWRDYEAGTASRLALHCPHCGGFVTPEREHLQGWQGASSELEAMARAHYVCPACGEPWSEAERYRANAEAVLVHRGQEVGADGQVTGPAPETRTLGFRWSSVNNMFMSPAKVGAAEWAAARIEDDEKKDLAERELLQYLWAMPYVDRSTETRKLDSTALMARPAACKRGELPEWAKVLTVGVDVGKYYAHWTASAWGEEARGAVIDYGVAEFVGSDQDEDRAVLTGLTKFAEDYLEAGWGGRRPDVVLVDSRWKGSAVREFIRKAGNDRYYPSLGFGSTQRWMGSGMYRRPQRLTQLVHELGEGYHVEYDLAELLDIVKVDADYWKSWVHRRLETAAGLAGSLVLFAVAEARGHLRFTKHLTAEEEVEEFERGRLVRRWVARSKVNHWLDSTALSAVAAHMAGVRLLVENAECGMRNAESGAGGSGGVSLDEFMKGKAAG